MSRLSRPLISAIGVLAVLVILGAGTLLALPWYLQSVTADAQSEQIISTNGLQQAQVALLDQQSERMTELAAEVTTLREQIPHAPWLDDAVELAAVAADATGAQIEQLTAGTPTAFTPRSEAIAAAARTTSSGEGETSEGGATVPEATQHQVAVSIRVTADTADQLAGYLDRLRTGSRLAAITTVVAAPTGGAERVEMTVEMLVFFETSGAEHRG